MRLNDVLEIIDTNQQQSVTGLKELLAIPSVSTAEAYRKDIDRCARLLVKRLGDVGLSAQIKPTAGFPIVLGRSEHKAGRPTVLVYGHYDVQPPDPLDQWQSPPFEPEVRDGAIYARGAADDKGQVWAHLQAMAAWRKAGGLPVNLIVLLESEEEVGSPSLPVFLHEHRAELSADIALMSDTAQYATGIPAITYSTRGLVYIDVLLRGADHDLHSGVHGGAAPNAANSLVKLLATLHNADGTVNVPGFYDDVAPITAHERSAWQELAFDDAAYARSLGIKFSQLTGEQGYSTLERQWARPTCDINGLTAGYQGPGSKTVIGATASAKVSCRLVPNQDPQKIVDALVKALHERCDSSVTMQVTVHASAEPGLVAHDSRAIHLASEAVEIGFGVKPVLIRSGGTLPIVAMLKQELNLDALLVGFSLPDDRVHSPNEKFSLAALHQGTRTIAALYQKLSQLHR